MEIGQNCTLKFGDNTIAKVILVAVNNYAYMPCDYWFNYTEDETNKQLIHPDYGKYEHIKGEVLLPEEFVKMIITVDEI